VSTPSNFASVAERLAEICDAQPFVTRFAICNLLTGETIERGADDETPSASTRKTSIMMAALKAAQEGRLDLDEPITYEARFAEEVASGMFRYLTPGIVISLRDAITGMMVLSDNVCTKMVFERLMLEEVDGYCKSIGLAGTHHRFLIPPLALSPDHALKSVTTTTARDQAVLLQMILDAQTSSTVREKLGVSADTEEPDSPLCHSIAPAVWHCRCPQGRHRQAWPHECGHRLSRRCAVLHHLRLYG